MLMLGLVLALSVAEAAPPRKATDFKFDGFRLGDVYGTAIMPRPPYSTPCDNDPVDKKTRRAMVYGALPCRDLRFPDATTVVFLLKFNADKYNQPVEAFAWLHGSYFNGKTDFPLKPGDAYALAVKTLGAEKRGAWPLGSTADVMVHAHAGDIHVVEHGGRVIGFVLGAMPADPENEQWQVIAEMHRRYTPQVHADPASQAKNADACRKARQCCSDVNAAHRATLGGGSDFCDEAGNLGEAPTTNQCNETRTAFTQILTELKASVPASCRAP